MSIITIILLAIGMAMDCFAVSIAQGMTVDLHSPTHRPRPILMATLFGVFQGAMPLISFYAGSIWADFFHTYAPWIALLLLGFIGGRMIWESLKKKEHHADWSIVKLLAFAVATSIDAFSIGVLFIPCPEVLWKAVSIIAFVSLVFSIVGYLIGVYVEKHFRLNVELLGGLLLVGIGIKIWLQGCL